MPLIVKHLNSTYGLAISIYGQIAAGLPDSARRRQACVYTPPPRRMVWSSSRRYATTVRTTGPSLGLWSSRISERGVPFEIRVIELDNVIGV
jgi:hypothetical protein